MHVVLDAELAWRLARKGAIFIFDDYLWTTEPNDSIHHPKRGIDSFLALHDGQYEKLYGPDSYQVIIKKTSDMRIGFLVKADTNLTLDTNRQLDSSFGYSINVALTVDSNYAPAAAVAMCTAAEMTPGRISFYVVDCGLSADARDGLRRSLPERSNVTISFIDVAADGLTLTAGPIWAKVEMIGFLPVERVLYLDADVLVRADLAKLWRFDLGSKSVGAAVDVGFPAGHGEHAGPPYFNAGVLLIDLARVRRRLDDLLKTAESMRTARFADQDALNAHFGDDWTELPVAWNAQGLGTYATNIAPERERIRPALDDMCSSPHIVHFTGPVHPKLAAVLNPYVQPFTSKPWGYAGAPGHPFARGWWDALERTAWRGWKDSDEHRAQVTEGRKNAETEGMLTFAEVVDNALVEQ
jgi:lipopolysaccharide biosynthesis glycosyltransferase